MTNGSHNTPVAQAAVRGVVAAMAMSGLRNVTGGLGLLDESPPDAIAERHADHLLARLRIDRDAVIELGHWTYGAVGGALFGALPGAVRRHAWSGPVYGIATWLFYETAVAPLLGLGQVQQKTVVGRLALAADHVLYGTIVGRRAAAEARRSRY
jgi:hypothetical protein